jgi:hypothetical protein
MCEFSVSCLTSNLYHVCSSSSAISSGSINRWGRTPVARPRSSEHRSLVLIENSNGGVGAMSPNQRDLRRAASEGNTGPGATSAGASDGVPSDTTEDDWSRGSGEDPDLELDQDLGHGEHTEITELDRRVSWEKWEMKVTQHIVLNVLYISYIQCDRLWGLRFMQ